MVNFKIIFNSSDISGGNDSIRPHVLSDNSGYYIMGRSTSSYAILWKYLFSSPSSYYCQEIPTIVNFSVSQKLISSSEFFLQGVGPSLSYYLYTYKIQFGSTSVTWANRMGCPSSSWSCSGSESVLSTDGSAIYSFFTYGYYTYLYIISFSVSSGTVLGSRYKSNSSWNTVHGSIVNRNYVITSAYWGGHFLLIYNPLIDSFLIKYFRYEGIFRLEIEPIIQR